MRGPAAPRRDINAPRHVVALSSTRAASPAPRAMYQVVIAAHRALTSAAGMALGQPAVVVTAPDWSTSRAAYPCSPNQSSAPSPSTIAAVLAAFACNASPAATVAVR